MKKLVKVLGLGLALSLGSVAGSVAIAHDHGNGGYEGKMMERGERMMKRMFSRLDLTEAQREAVTEIRQDAQAAMAELKEQSVMSRGEFKEQMREIVQADEFDEQAFRQLMALKQTDRGEMAVIRAKMKHDIWHVLDAQQQAKMTEMMEKRGERRGKRAFGRDGE